MSRFIDSQRADYGIPHSTACRALGVSQAWFYKWRHGDPLPRHARRVALTAEIKRLFARHKGKYGSPRITTHLTEAGWTVDVGSPLEDGSVVLEAQGPPDGCRAEVRFTPLPDPK